MPPPDICTMGCFDVQKKVHTFAGRLAVLAGWASWLAELAGWLSWLAGCTGKRLRVRKELELSEGDPLGNSPGIA